MIYLLANSIFYIYFYQKGAGGSVHVYAHSITCIDCSKSLISSSGAAGWAQYYGGGGGGRIVVSLYYNIIY